MTTETTTEQVARQAAAAFQTSKRHGGDAGDDYYVTLRDEAPEWVRDAVYAAHVGMLPDDWKYAAIRAAFEHIAEGGDEDAHEFADSYVDAYTGARLEWLSSNLNRAGYIEEAVSEGLAGDTQDPAELAGIGQYMEAAEVYAYAWRAVSEQAEEVTA